MSIPRPSTQVGPVPTVVVDANVIIRSPRLSSGAWRAALHARDSGALELRVPEVALLEAGAWFEREVPERVRRYTKQASLLSQVGILLDNYGVPAPAAVDRLGQEVVGGYEAYLRERFGEAAILPIPTVEHRVLVERATQRAKPFNESGSGYRDALIWESVCDLALSRPISFVSDNTKDFAGDDGALAGELSRDLEGRRIDRSAVRLFTDLLEVVTIYVPEAADARARVEEVMSSEPVVGQLEEEFAQTFATYEGISLPSNTPGLHALMWDAAVEGVWDLKDVRVVSVKPIGDATYLVVGTAQGMAQAYSVREQVGITDIDAVKAGVDGGFVDEWYQRGPDLVLLKYLPVEVTFEANLDPGDLVWNAGVVDVRPLDLA